jgi:hypothetical protein
MRVLIFFSIFTLLSAGIHALFYWRVIRTLSYNTGIKKLLTTLILTNLLFTALYALGRYTDGMPMSLYYLFSLSIGILFILLLYLILHEIIHLFDRLVSLTSLSTSRRDFFKRSRDHLLMTFAGGYLGVAIHEGQQHPQIETVKLGLFDLGQDNFRGLFLKIFNSNL